MRWKQFFTPVKSFNAAQAQQFIEEKPPAEITVLDVRQPGEYKSGHIPGAKLIPLTELSERISEISPEKPTVVYCAIGGRSRVAAQMLSGKGFEEVYNLTGGFKAWNSKAAYGESEQGLALFTGDESPEQTLIVAYSLEQGLGDFYLSMIPRVKNEDAKALFKKLSDIETKHQDRVLSQYNALTGQSVTQEAFEKNTVSGIAEGGLTTEEYIQMFQPDPESVAEIIELAMSIEAQALDLYTRAADKTSNPETRNALMQIADEERAHLNQLGKLIDGL